MRRVVGRMLSVLGLTVCVGGGMLAGGCTSLPPEVGPTVGVRNDSDAPLRATFWIGDRDSQKPSSPADMHAQETMEIAPYGTKQFRLGAFSGYESPTRSFVRVQIQPVGASFEATKQHWFELDPPSPYTIRVYGNKSDLKFARAGAGTMVAVPSSLWFAASPTPAAGTTNTNRGGTATTATSTGTGKGKPPLRVVGAPN